MSNIATFKLNQSKEGLMLRDGSLFIYSLNDIYMYINLAYCISTSYQNELQFLLNLFENLKRRNIERFWYRKKPKPYQTRFSLDSVQKGMKWLHVFAGYNHNCLTQTPWKEHLFIEAVIQLIVIDAFTTKVLFTSPKKVNWNISWHLICVHL